MGKPLYSRTTISTLFMAKQFKLKVNDDFEYVFTAKDLEALDAVPNGEHSYHLIQDGQSFNIQFSLKDFDKKSYHVKVNNAPYEVSIANPLDLLIDEMGFALSSASQISSIEAPMPGLILEVSVREGQIVQEGEALLILEAMKMENVLTSPRNGTVKGIHVKQGQAVDKKHLLITFE